MFYDECQDERVLDEAHHFQAMLFKSQCLWRDFDEMVETPNNTVKANRLLYEIDVLEANLKDMGLCSST